jgi:hypothetical protein
MIKYFAFSGKVSKFPGKSGWFYVDVPKKFMKKLKEQRSKWGMYPIEVKVGNTSWKTKLMMKRGGDFFVALKVNVREKEKITKGKIIKVNVTL